MRVEVERSSGSGISTSGSSSTARAEPPAADAAVRAQRLADLPADGAHRVERRLRLLEDHRDLARRGLVELALGKRRAPPGRDLDGTGRDGAAGQQAEDRAGGHRLARTRTRRRARRPRPGSTRTVMLPHGGAGMGERDAEVGDLESGRRSWRCSFRRRCVTFTAPASARAWETAGSRAPAATTTTRGPTAKNGLVYMLRMPSLDQRAERRVGGRTPMPRKLIAPSMNTATDIDSASCTMQRLERVRQNVPAQNPAGAGADDCDGLDVRHLADRQHGACA